MPRDMPVFKIAKFGYRAYKVLQWGPKWYKPHGAASVKSYQGIHVHC